MDSEQLIINEKMSNNCPAIVEEKIEGEIIQVNQKVNEASFNNLPVENQDLDDKKIVDKVIETAGTSDTERVEENDCLVQSLDTETLADPTVAENVEEKTDEMIVQTTENETQYLIHKNTETFNEKSSMNCPDQLVPPTNKTKAENVEEKIVQDLVDDKMMIEPTEDKIHSDIIKNISAPSEKTDVNSVDQIHQENLEEKIIENNNSEVVDMIVETVEEKTVENCDKNLDTIPSNDNSPMTPTLTENSSSMLIEKMDENEKPQVVFESTVNTNGNASNALGCIASAYDSDDDKDSDDEVLKIDESKIEENEIVEVPVDAIDASKSKDYRTKDVEFDVESSDSEDDSSSSCSSSSSSSSDSTSSDSSDSSPDDDEDEDDSISKTPASKKKEKKTVKNKGEFDDLPPIEDLTISVDEVLCEPLGKVGWMVDQMVVVLPSPGKPTLNIDTVLFLEKGKRVLGRIFDVFGQVKEPHYCVRFNTSEHIKESNIHRDMIVYFVPDSEHTSLVFLSELRKIKAVDEVGSDEDPDFSDDEAEKAYRNQMQQQKSKSNPDVPAKRPRSGWKSRHPWSSDNQFSRPNNRQQQNRQNNNYPHQYQQVWAPHNYMQQQYQQYHQQYYNPYSYYGQQMYQPRPEMQNYSQASANSYPCSPWYWASRPSMPPPPPPPPHPEGNEN